MNTEMKEETTVLQTSKVKLMMLSTEKTASFVAKMYPQGGSLRLTVPVEVKEVLDLRPNDFVEITIQKKTPARKADDGLTGGFEK